MTQIERERPRCHWCGVEVGFRVWKDGKNMYCSPDCHSAGLLPGFVLVIVVFTPVFVIDLALSGFILSLFIGHYEGNPILGYSLYMAMLVVYIVGILFAYRGWKARREIPRAQMKGVTDFGNRS